MAMEINGVNPTINTQTVTNEVKNSDNTKVTEKKPTESKLEEVGVTYEKTESQESGLYKINKLSKEDRAALVNQLKADMENQKQQMLELVNKTMSGQVGLYGKANDESFWRMLAGGNFKVDAATKAKAQSDIGEDGYWGVKQTSQRLFDFASALAGDDVDKMKEMQKAMHKGFNLATKAWGKKLPDISQRTMDAADALFDNYYKSKETPMHEVISEE